MSQTIDRDYSVVYDWNDERVALLTKMWEEGLTASEIARLMPGELTRNSVIGKAHRLELPARTPRNAVDENSAWHKKKMRGLMHSSSKLATTELGIVHSEVIGVRDVIRRWAEFSGPVTSCQWIYPGDNHPMCGKDTVPGKSWCKEHYERVYLPPLSQEEIKEIKRLRKLRREGREE